MYKESCFEVLKHLPYILIKNEKVVEVSYPLTDITGYIKDEIVQKSMSEVFKKFFKNNYCALDFENNDEEQIFFMFTKSHEVKHVSILSYPGLGVNEKIYVFLEKPNSRLEEKLPLMQRLYLDNLIGIAVYSVPELILLKANEQYLLSLPEPYNKLEKVIGLKISEFIPDWNENPLKKVWLDAIESGKTSHIKDYMSVIPDKGETFWDFTLIPVSENGKIKYIVVMLNNVTDRVLEEKQREYQANIYTLEIPIMRVSYPDFFILEINKKGYEEICSITGLDTQKLDLLKPGEKMLNALPIFGNEENFKKIIYEVEKTRKTFYQKKFKFNKCGKDTFYNLIYQPILDSYGRIREILIIGIDITHEVEERNEVENAIKMKDEFFSFICHEFRTPLTVITAATQAIESICKDDLSPKAKGYLNIIHQNSLRQMRLINNLLDITSAGSGYIKIHKKNMDIVSLTKAIVDSVMLYAEERGITLKFSAPDSQYIIGIDDEKYERILLNLLSNAIKFTPRGKSVFVNIQFHEHKVCIEVKDKGVGIPKDKLDVIFNRFGQVNSNLTRMSEGTGIGLYLVKLLVNALGGEISVESTQGKGSTFKILLPDTKALENENENGLQQISDSRLIQMAAVEFSDIYLSNQTK